MAALEKAKATAAFAELQGLKEALAAVAVPGKDGSLSISKGDDAALMLRVKTELLSSMDKMAEQIVARLDVHGGTFVLARDEDIASAQKSTVWMKRFKAQAIALEEAIVGAALVPKSASAGGVTPQAMGTGAAAALAGAQTIPFVLNALSDAAKVFRVDRTISVFSASDEAQRLLELLVERRGSRARSSQITRIDGLGNTVVEQAEQLLSTMDRLFRLHHRATMLLGDIQRAIELAAKAGLAPADAGVPTNEVVVRLSQETLVAKQMVDAFNPNTSPEVFWGQVAGQTRQNHLEGRARVHIKVTAQAIQTMEKRVLQSDRLVGSAELLVEYRISGADGRFMSSGVKLHATANRNVFDPDGVLHWETPEP